MNLVRGSYTNVLYNAANLTVEGAMKDVALTSTGARAETNVVGETILTKNVLQRATGFTLNGLKLTASTAIYLRGSYGSFTAEYCNLSYSGQYGVTEKAVSDTTTQPADQTHSDITFRNNYFKSSRSGASADLYFVSKVNHLTVENNYFDSKATGLVATTGETTTYEDYAIYIGKPATDYEYQIKGNTFNHLGAYYVLSIGELLTSQTAYKVNIEDNLFTPSKTTGLDGNGVQVLRTKKDGLVNFVHNTITTSSYFNAVVITGGVSASSSTTVTTAVNLLYNKFYWWDGPNPGFRNAKSGNYSRVCICIGTEAPIQMYGNYYQKSTSGYAFTNMTSNSSTQGSYFKNGGTLGLKNEECTESQTDIGYTFHQYVEELKAYGDITGVNARYGGTGENDICTYIPSFASKHDGKLVIEDGVLYHITETTTSSQQKCALLEKIPALSQADSTSTQRAALLATAYAYLDRGANFKYDESFNRRTVNAAPEDGNTTELRYLDCSSFVNATYYHTFGQDILTSGAVKTQAFMNYAKNNSSANDVVYYYQVTGQEDAATQASIIAEIQGLLLESDLLVYRQENDTAGHVMMYLGNDQFIHATGGSYKIPNINDPNTAYEYTTNSEKDGTVQLLDASALFTTDGARYLFNKEQIAILRPLVRDNMEVTGEAAARVELGRAYIEKTVWLGETQLTNYSTVCQGAELTVKLTVKNMGGDSNPLNPFVYQDTVPTGTEYVAGSAETSNLISADGATVKWQRTTTL